MLPRKAARSNRQDSAPAAPETASPHTEEDAKRGADYAQEAELVRTVLANMHFYAADASNAARDSAVSLRRSRSTMPSLGSSAYRWFSGRRSVPPYPKARSVDRDLAAVG